MKLKLIIFAILFLLSSNVASAQNFDIVRPDKEAWVCVDYAVDYANNNPEWGIVSISNNPRFAGVSHMVNYLIIDDETIRIHDEMYNHEYEVHNWFLDGNFYHFWIDEPIKRNYKFLLDNRGVVL